jgi:hypothetical protein
LIDATDGYSLYPFDTTGRHDLARIGDDGPRLDSCRRLLPAAHFCSDRNQHREQRQRAWRQYRVTLPSLIEMATAVPITKSI